MTEQQQYLYTIRPTRPQMLTDGPTPEESKVLGEHFAYLEKLAEQGTVILAGRTLNTDESSFGIVILEVASEAEAQTLIDSDPAVQNGVMKAKLYPYRVALMRQDSEAE
jgi:uncharacterized protein YciI